MSFYPDEATSRLFKGNLNLFDLLICMSFYLVILEDSDRTTHGMWVVADHGAAQAKLNELLPLEPGFKAHLAGPYNFGEDILDDRVYYTVTAANNE